MDVKIGDRVSIDALKVGQARRAGTVKEISQGMAGVRFLVSWDDGHESFFSPSGGNLIVESGRAARKSGNSIKQKPVAAASKKTGGRGTTKAKR